jgi:DNA-binding CsgD family transcriptional regulator
MGLDRSGGPQPRNHSLTPTLAQRESEVLQQLAFGRQWKR